jgi:hypothetical protein
MKVALLVEDRDLGWLFLDTEKADPDASIAELTLAPDVFFDDIGSEEQTQWLMNDKGDQLRVVLRENFDYDGDFADSWPIPTPEIVIDKDEYDRRQQQ